MLALDYCHKLVDEGFEVLPIAPGTKRPTKGFEWRNPHSPEELHSILNVHTGGIGVLCSDRLLCIDFDADADENFYKFISRVFQERPDLAQNCYAEQSPNGFHLVFQTKEPAPNGAKLAWRNTIPGKYDPKHKKYEQKGERILLIETKGEGGYFVAFPTTGYTWVQIPMPDGTWMPSKAIWDLTDITKSDVTWLLDLARSFDTYVGPVREKKRSVPEVSPERQAERNRELAREWKSGWTISDPIEYWGSACSQERYEEILKDYDWQKGKTDENGRIWYWRPGLPQDPKNYSGNLYKKEDCWLLYIFTTNSELPADSGLAAWQFLMYQEGFTDAKYPELIQPDEIREWKNAWYNDMAERTEVFWKPTADHLNVLQDQFNWR